MWSGVGPEVLGENVFLSVTKTVRTGVGFLLGIVYTFLGPSRGMFSAFLCIKEPRAPLLLFGGMNLP